MCHRRIRCSPTGLAERVYAAHQPLGRAQGIDAYWSNKGIRTPEEERVNQAVSNTLNEAREAWSNLELTDDIKEAGLQLVDAALQGELPIANAAARLLHGERTETIELIESFVLGLTLFDCQRTEMNDVENL